MTKQRRILSRATLLSTLFLSPLALADIVVTNTQGVQQTLGAPGGFISFGQDGTITGTMTSGILFNQTAADATATVSKTTVAKQMNIIGKAFEVNNAVTGRLTNIDVKSGAVVESTLALLDAASTLQTAGIITLSNAGTMSMTGGLALNGIEYRNNDAGLIINNKSTGVMQLTDASVGATGVLFNQTAAAARTGTLTITNNGVMKNSGTNTTSHGFWVGSASVGAQGVVSITNLNPTTGAGATPNTATSYTKAIMKAGGNVILLDTPHVNTATTILNDNGQMESTAAEAIYIKTDTSAGTLVNQNTGSIKTSSTGASAIKVEHHLSAFRNLGANSTVQSVDGFAFETAGGFTLGEFTNEGKILQTGGGAGAVSFGGVRVVTAFSNTGSIISTNQTAISAAAGVTFPGGLTNAGGIITGGNKAIDFSLVGNPISFTLSDVGTNIGTITGDVLLGTNAVTNVFKVTGGRLIGKLIGNAGVGVPSSFEVNGAFTTEGDINDIKSIKVGTVAPAGNLTVNNNITGVTTLLDVNTGSILKINAGKTITSTVGPTGTGVYNFELGSGLSAMPFVSNGNVVGKINATAAAINIANRSFTITNNASGYMGTGARFYIITTTGLVTNGVGASAAVLAPPASVIMSYAIKTANNDGVYVETTRATPENVNLGAGTQASNARAVLTALESLKTNTNAQAIHGALQNFSDPTLLRQTLDRMTPDIRNGTDGAFVASHQVLNSVQQRLLALREEDTLTPSMYSAGTPAWGRGYWVRLLAGFARQDLLNSMQGYDASTYGLAMGTDWLVSPYLHAGIAAGITNSTVNSTHAVRNSTTVDSYSGMLYASFDSKKNYFLDGMIGYVKNHYESLRQITVAPLAAVNARGLYWGWQSNARVLAGYTFKYGDYDVSPLLGGRLAYTRVEPYTETGAGPLLNMFVESARLKTGMVSAGARFHRRFVYDAETTIEPKFYGLVNVDMLDRQSSASIQFTNSGAAVGSAFTAQGPINSRLGFSAGASVAFLTKRHWQVQLGYDFEGRSQFGAHAFTSNFRYTW